MTRARNVGGASVAARRLLVLAAAVAGFWLVSWLTSGDADAATSPVLPDPVGVAVGALSPPAEVGHAAVARDVADAGRSFSGKAEVVAGGQRAAKASSRPDAASDAADVVAAPVSRTVRAAAPITKPVSHAAEAAVVRSIAPVARAAEAAVSPVAAGAATVVEPVSQVVRSAVPLVRPVSGAAQRVLSPVTKTAAAAVVRPVAQLLHGAEPLVSAVARPVARLVDPLTGAVKPVTASLLGPVLGVTSPVLTDLLTPVVDSVGRPVVAPVADAVGPVGSLGRPVPLPARASSGIPSLSRQFVPTPEPAAVTPVEPAGPVAASGPACGGTAATGSHRRSLAAHHAGAQLGRHVPPHPPAPAPPGAPVSSDVTSGTGSTIPFAFLTAGHAPHDFRASPWTHGEFVPLWRPCEPGTGPG
ncbi:hypothetical protein Q5425_04130 [Amycolatopsis sp. A133]|uniref:hypothetical protein n=1 Tax=Amycolatopsis sp. A133 TaxID=3064472 RepID=UPI0027FD4C1B|nr:hypothetical protein [Amycolatopsis sp. A133]MDQ7802904.1 hypothetical protein [Amycolatopsis sp. A133]